jgi:hypothetical protein
VNEPGYVEVPSSITAAVAAQQGQKSVAEISSDNQETQQMQQNVLDSFGMM